MVKLDVLGNLLEQIIESFFDDIIVALEFFTR